MICPMCCRPLIKEGNDDKGNVILNIRGFVRTWGQGEHMVAEVEVTDKEKGFLALSEKKAMAEIRKKRPLTYPEWLVIIGLIILFNVGMFLWMR